MQSREVFSDRVCFRVVGVDGVDVLVVDHPDEVFLVRVVDEVSFARVVDDTEKVPIFHRRRLVAHTRSFVRPGFVK